MKRYTVRRPNDNLSILYADDVAIDGQGLHFYRIDDSGARYYVRSIDDAVLFAEEELGSKLAASSFLDFDEGGTLADMERLADEEAAEARCSQRALTEAFGKYWTIRLDDIVLAAHLLREGETGGVIDWLDDEIKAAEEAETPVPAEDGIKDVEPEPLTEEQEEQLIDWFQCRRGVKRPEILKSQRWRTAPVEKSEQGYGTEPNTCFDGTDDSIPWPALGPFKRSLGSYKRSCLRSPHYFIGGSAHGARIYVADNQQRYGNYRRESASVSGPKIGKKSADVFVHDSVTNGQAVELLMSDFQLSEVFAE